MVNALLMRKPKVEGVNSIKKIQTTQEHPNPKDRWSGQLEENSRDTSGLDYSFRASDSEDDSEDDSEEDDSEEDENDLTLGSEHDD